MIWALAIFILTLAGKLFVDLRLYFSGKANNHKLGPAMVFVALVAASWVGGWQSIGMWFFGFWVGMDTLYGVFIGQGPFYVGTTAWLDRMQRKHEWLVIVKYSLFAASIAFYFITR